MDIENAQFVNIFNFSTTQAKPIVYLHVFNLAVCAIIGILVTGLVLYAAFKFRHREGDAEPRQDHGNVKLELLWTIGPLVIVTILGILAAMVMRIVDPPLHSKMPDVIVIGHQWWWEYRYPKLGIVTANELYLPRDVDALFEIRAADVTHSFWIPAFGQKMDAIPGHPNLIFYKPTKTGIFLGTCSEFCGEEHALMRIFAKVVEPEEFQTWTKQQTQTPVGATDTVAQHGKDLFIEKTCVQCHAIAGTEATAQIGPDLTHVANRMSLGSGVIPNNLENLTQWIMNPQQFKPGIHMPDMRLSRDDAHAIAVYLENLK